MTKEWKSIFATDQSRRRDDTAISGGASLRAGEPRVLHKGPETAGEVCASPAETLQRVGGDLARKGVRGADPDAAVGRQLGGTNLLGRNRSFAGGCTGLEIELGNEVPIARVLMEGQQGSCRGQKPEKGGGNCGACDPGCTPFFHLLFFFFPLITLAAGLSIFIYIRCSDNRIER